MFTDQTKTILTLAKDNSYSSGSAELVLPALIGAMCDRSGAKSLLAECSGLSEERLRAICPTYAQSAACPGKLPLAQPVRTILIQAKALAAAVPDASHPGLIDLRHLACALSMSQEVCRMLEVTPLERESAIALLSDWYQKQGAPGSLEDLTVRMRGLRAELLANIFGQDHAVDVFVEGLFNAELVASADTKRKSPQALFVFAGPPGVGKTFLAELGAAHLALPYRRFDMSAYSGQQQNEALIGMARSFQGAHPGILTEFVENSPNAFLLFDEIEKSHANTIHLFLQILDAGTLEDKFYERNVSFRDTTIIFTTNAGRKLYDSPNTSGVHRVNAAFHRRTVLDALETEINPLTREPFFPSTICSRLATGYPVLFNHLRVNELERVVRAELSRVTSLFELQYFKRTSFDDLLPTALVLREGARADARTVRSQTETFFKTEIYKFCQLFKTDRIENALEKVKSIRFEGEIDNATPETGALFSRSGRPQILLVADLDLAALYLDLIPEVQWYPATSAEEALRCLGSQEVDMVLLDLWLNRVPDTYSATCRAFDYVPAATRSLDQGQELLRKIHERFPSLPIYLLSPAQSGIDDDAEGAIDEELFRACVRGGGARGVIVTEFVDGMAKGWEQHRERFLEKLIDTCGRLHMERWAERLANERKVLTFDTAPQLDHTEPVLTIRLRKFSLTRAVAAMDATEVLEEVERPPTRFADVIGADTAKEELGFFVDYLKNPRRFAALGLTPPKGVLLYGPPGTGKTMLARAMAGESSVAFLPSSATSFVTIWQGSGPQNIRDLFARARRYAPAIVFIDEIDAIGKGRSALPGAGRAEETTLNALLAEMDGFTSSSPERPVFVLAATNFKIASEGDVSSDGASRTLDPALVRRFSRAILVDLPDTAARKRYLQLRLSNDRGRHVNDECIELLADKSTGMSIAGLEQVLEVASRNAFRRNMGIDDRLLQEALDTAREGEVREWSPEFLESTARHEAGHTIIYWLSGWWAPEVSVVARANRGGGMRRSEVEMKRESLTKEEMLWRIRTYLGGRAAEMLFYGQENGLTTGAVADLEQATTVACQMVCKYGMVPEFGLLSMPELLKYAEALASPFFQRITELARKILDVEMDKTLKALEQNRAFLDAVAISLLQKNRLYQKDLEQILEPSERRTTAII
jgi:cell division protease FtsH